MSGITKSARFRRVCARVTLTQRKCHSLPAPATIESVLLRVHILIAANNNVDAIKAWPARVLDVSTTFNNYRKEAERLLLWSPVQIGKPLSSLNHEDFLVYQHSLSDSQPASAGDGRKFARADPERQPFAGALSPPPASPLPIPASIADLRHGLGTLFNPSFPSCPRSDSLCITLYKHGTLGKPIQIVQNRTYEDN